MGDVGMAYLLGNWAIEQSPGDHWRPATGDHRLISNMFDFSLLTGLQATAVAQRPVCMVVNRLVGTGL